MAGYTYWLGTDGAGRDLVSAMLYGLRISLAVGVVSCLIATVIGAAVGLVAAYAGGRTESLLMRLVDLQLSFPAILIALMLIAILGKGVDKIIIALVTVQWAYYARTVRGTALAEMNKEYVEAARCLGLQPRPHPLQADPAQLPAAADRGGDGAGRARHRARGHAVVPGRRPAAHRALARPADRQRLRVHAVGQVLDQLLSRRSCCSPPSWPSTWSATSCATCSTPGSSDDGGGRGGGGGDRSRPTLEVVDLKTHFFTKAGVVQGGRRRSFRVAPGEVLGLVGESGCGKSVTGYLHPRA